MKTLGKALKAAVLLTAYTAILCANSQARDMPQKSFACQVQAKNGIQGLVLVQVDNRSMAFEVASSSIANTLNGKQSPTIAVVQCIELPKGRFTDSTFQKFFETTPL
ncbi:MAG: hypothetical protein ACI9DH_000786 [Halioglobus sp.]|jgi:hypothetical protein